MPAKEIAIQQEPIAKLGEPKCTRHPYIRDRSTMQRNFLEKFEALNRVYLAANELQRLCETTTFSRDDGTPLHYTLVNTCDWCKNTFEIVDRLRISHDVSYRHYDLILLISGVPAVQIELMALGINPRRAMRQVVRYKVAPGNGCIWHTTGSGKTLASFKASTLLKDKWLVRGRETARMSAHAQLRRKERFMEPEPTWAEGALA